MKIQEIFNLALKMGREADFRSEQEIDNFLARKRKRYEKLDEKAKDDFDKEELVNPYLDSRILHIADDREIKTVLVGIDIESAEILLAKELTGVDLIIAHHPRGKGLANLHDVMSLQCDVLNKYGVPINIAEGLMRERISEVARGINASNHERAVDTARLLGFNFMCVHTPCDNMAANFLKPIVEDQAIETVGDLVEKLKDIPEYRKAQEIGAGPKIFAGSPENRAGRITLTEITGGTEGSPKLYEKMAQAGIGTVIGMHQSEEHRKEAEAANVNVVIAGHISSDSIGVNLFLDVLEKNGVRTIPCSGLIRVARDKNK
ncbi:MAG: NGG1p interacting factor NIF3 [Candidatus Pacebacteria bacterium]|nr:NGG1p interacting factor NIF3 [Candidatus Paceibacterota bacterium]